MYLLSPNAASVASALRALVATAWVGGGGGIRAIGVNELCCIYARHKLGLRPMVSMLSRDARRLLLLDDGTGIFEPRRAAVSTGDS